MGKKFFVTDGKTIKRGKGPAKDLNQVMFDKAEAGKAKAKEPVKVRCRPLGDRMLVRRIEEAQRGLIIAPGNYKDPSERGEIVAIGPGRFEEPTTLKVGERVMFNKHGVMELEIDGEVFVLMRESDAIAII